MEMYGLDITAIIITAGFVVFWGVILLAFVLYKDRISWLPRKYYKIRLENKDGFFLRYIKGWAIKANNVPYLRLGLRGFPSFNGVEKDISLLSSIDSEGVLTFTEEVPDRFVPTNYSIKEVPLTQKDRFINEERENIVRTIGNVLMFGITRDENGNPIPDNAKLAEIVENATLKTRETLSKNSRIEDMNTSRATKEYIAQARREAERVKGDDFIYKYGPIIALIIAALFAYLIIDGSIKAYQNTMAQTNGVMQNGYSQLITQCGGIYKPAEPENKTATAPGKVAIPFVTT